FLVLETGLLEEALGPAARREQTVVVSSAASDAHVGIGEAARDPAQERQAEMRLDQAPAVRHGEVADAAGAQNAPDLPEVVELGGGAADVRGSVVSQAG